MTQFFEISPASKSICVHATLLINEGVISKAYYDQLVYQKKINRVQLGGNGRPALIEYTSIPYKYRQKIEAIVGFDPTQINKQSTFENEIQPDPQAVEFFTTYKLPTGAYLPEATQLEYITNAEVIQAVHRVATIRAQKLRKLGNTTRNVWTTVSNSVNSLNKNKYPHTLPANERRLKDRVNRFLEEGYMSLVHKNFCNSNAEKITGAAADWILAYYSLPTKPSIPMLMESYREVRAKKGFPQITDNAVFKWLNEPEQRRLWVEARHGTDSWKNKFGYSIKRDRSQWFPNAWWAIDGTKLDWIHYEDNVTKMAAKIKIDPVIDVFSEKIIGWSISETENHVDHFRAVKMAIENAGSRPYLFTYDNQSGHKSSKMQELYTAIVAREGGTHYPHKAYNKSNPIEQLFNRFQQQVISAFWFSDKQSITVRREDNRPNMEFVTANKHRLPNRNEIIEAWKISVEKWNSMPHPHLSDKSRNEVYAMPQPISEPIEVADVMEIFWLNETKPKTYHRYGMPLVVGNEKYEYEVFDANGNIDIEFRRKYVGKKLIVKYSPDDLDLYIGLYEPLSNGDKRFVAYAQPRRSHESIPVLMEEGDKEAWYRDYQVTMQELDRDRKELEAIRKRSGITPESIIDQQELLIKMGGRLPKEDRSDIESESIFHRL